MCAECEARGTGWRLGLRGPLPAHFWVLWPQPFLRTLFTYAVPGSLERGEQIWLGIEKAAKPRPHNVRAVGLTFLALGRGR